MAIYKRCKSCNDIQLTYETEYLCFSCALASHLRAFSFWQRVRFAWRVLILGGDAIDETGGD